MVVVIGALALAGCGGSDDNAGNADSTIPGDVNAGAQASPQANQPTTATSTDTSSSGTQQTEGSAEAQNRAQQQAERNKSNFKPEPPPTMLYSSPTSAARVSKPTLVNVRTQAQLDRLIARENDGNPSGAPKLTVKFGDGRQAWALFMPQSPGGSHVMITSVRSNGKTVRVVASIAKPGGNCKVPIKGKTHPTSWVETNELPGRPDLHLIPIRTAC